MTPSRRLADFLAGLDGRVDDRLTGTAINCLVDTLGAIVYGLRLPWSQSVIAHAAATGADGPCEIVGGTRTAPAMAALANGASAHGFELDDVHEEAISHPGAVVVPAALALGQELDASGPPRTCWAASTPRRCQASSAPPPLQGACSASTARR